MGVLWDSNQLSDFKMCGASGMNGRKENCTQALVRDHLEDLDLDGRAILKWLLKK
jgi:hypothetical protein